MIINKKSYENELKIDNVQFYISSFVQFLYMNVCTYMYVYIYNNFL